MKHSLKIGALIQFYCTDCETETYLGQHLFAKKYCSLAPHSSTLAWKISWAEEPGRPQSMGSHFRDFIGEGNGNSLQCSCLENPRDAGAWWAAVYGVAQSRTRLKQLSSSSSIAHSRNDAKNQISYLASQYAFQTEVSTAVQLTCR